MSSPPYLEPYETAVAAHGAGFSSLLWASEKTQAVRFRALCRLAPLDGLHVLDAGCGRADLRDFLHANDIWPARYTGLEGVPELATAAEAKVLGDDRIVRGDFVRRPSLFDCNADVILFSGSLNTLPADAFFRTLTRAYEACRRAVVFNFLAGPMLAGQRYLTWHRPGDVMAFASSTAGRVTNLDNYLDGDCTIAMHKDQKDHKESRRR